MGYDTSRVAPISEDLTKEDLSCQIVRGYSLANKVAESFQKGTVLVSGEWAVKTANGMERPGVASSNMSMLVIGGTERFDSQATGKVTVIQSSQVQVKTNKFAEQGTYAEGTELTVKNLGAQEAIVSPATAGDYIVAKVLECGNGFLVYETVPVIVKKA